MLKALIVLSVLVLSTKAQVCQYEANVDYFGNDLSQTPCFVKSLDECCALCSNVPQCAAWTYLPATGACWVKYTVTERRQCSDGRFSGCRSSTHLPYPAPGPAPAPQPITTTTTTTQPTPAPCPCQKETGVNYPGGDLLEAAEVPSADECCNFCRKTNGCVAFAYYSTYKYCYLKSCKYGDKGEKQSYPGMIYGVL